MGFRCGIIGLPNVGKSTLFNALTAGQAPAENYPFCTVEPNHGMVVVPDQRLEQVAALFRPEKVTPTAIELVDIAGLVEGASRGEGLGNQFLAHIGQVDAVAHVVRCFADANVVHVHGAVDPVRDVEVVETELLLRDLDVVSRRLEKQSKVARGGDKAAREEVPVLEKVERALAAGTPVLRLGLEPAERAQLGATPLLTLKPVLFVANVGDQGPDSSAKLSLCRLAEDRGAAFVAISARLEAELAELDPADQAAFMAELGLSDSGLRRLIQAGYQLLDLVTFFTTVGVEVRAWTVPRGTRAPQAAGRIHTDMERGFIRAEVVSSADLIALGSEQAVRERGLYRSEGRDYTVQDGDVIRFRFNV